MTIRLAQKEDMPRVLELIKALADFEKNLMKLSLH